MESNSARLASQVVIQLEPLDPSLVATFASNYSQGRGVDETDAGEETEGGGLFSDDTGFYSAVEDLTSQDEGEDEDDRRQREVDRNYPALLEKYCGLKHKAAVMKDPFNEVDFTELCLVLKMSAEKSGLLKAAELLDVALQIFFRQVSVCQRSVFRLAEELQKRGRRPGAGTGTAEQNGNVGGENGGGGGEQEARQRRAPIVRTVEKRGSWVDGEQAVYSFVKEISEQFVTRRVRMHEGMECIARNPYFDFEVDLGEFYEEEMRMEEEEGNQEQNLCAAQLIREMGRYANARRMGALYLPGGELVGGDDEEEGMDLLGMLEVVMDAENMEPEPFPLGQNEEEDVSCLSADDNLGVVEGVMEGEGGENVPPKEKGKKGSKKNRKRRRVPFGENQNIGEEDGGLGGGEKRARLEGDDGAIVGGEELGENGPHEQSTLVIDEEDFENWAADQLDLTLGVDGFDGSFRPPSPLIGQDWSLLNLNAKNHKYDMQAIKLKFKEIVNSAPPEKGEVTFVEILEKCEMTVLARSDQCVFRNHHHHQDSNLSTDVTATKEISVGVAFLAMLHNAASEGFYLREDPEGAFKVSREMPCEEGEMD